NNGQLQVRLRAPAGTKLDRTEQIALRALDVIKEELGAANVATTLGLVGVHAPNYPVNLIHAWNSGTDEATLQVQLKPGADVDLDAAKENLRRRLGVAMPDVRLSFERGHRQPRHELRRAHADRNRRQRPFPCGQPRACRGHPDPAGQDP
ncbi:MAG: hypothetical protein EBR95_11060, partial [Verrucomicrobia bacterium]|nr:hypothetical protein [Verrucomicrobiota bacterium]